MNTFHINPAHGTVERCSDPKHCKAKNHYPSELDTFVSAKLAVLVPSAPVGPVWLLKGKSVLFRYSLVNTIPKNGFLLILYLPHICHIWMDFFCKTLVFLFFLSHYNSWFLTSLFISRKRKKCRVITSLRTIPYTAHVLCYTTDYSDMSYACDKSQITI